jgi:C-terminal processing protease CtpA/Prc
MTKNIDDYDHPYHRLVSAPPGKIGLTFIEHRGHCMVSNVSGSSPLAGWVHPSDILIAIDDTPVSGLRTREIVNILTAKKERRRDLRMISSHDMNELIRPGTA